MKAIRHIPNTLTMIRMVLAVPLAYWLWEGKIPAALGLLVVAGITDLLDGYLAREFGWRTTLGTWLDPTADKILITTSLVTLTAKGFLPLWFCLVILGRDVGLVIGVVGLVWSGVSVKIQPLLTGKLAVTTQNLTLLLAMLLPVFTWAGRILPTMLAVATVVTAISSVGYARALASYRKQRVELGR
jgi:cardiolipin synthase (CMP-forming)